MPNYVEPFAGSLAVLLLRPHRAGRNETVNDKDCYLANFFRALIADLQELADYADGPVNEADLHARHRWLVAQTEFRTRMFTDPEYYDTKVAGWWVWGLSCWIGSGWCVRPEWVGRSVVVNVILVGSKFSRASECNRKMAGQAFTGQAWRESRGRSVLIFQASVESVTSYRTLVGMAAQVDVTCRPNTRQIW